MRKGIKIALLVMLLIALLAGLADVTITIFWGNLIQKIKAAINFGLLLFGALLVVGITNTWTALRAAAKGAQEAKQGEQA